MTLFRKIMATPKQNKLIKLIRENMGNVKSTKTLGELLLNAGYTKATAKNAYEIFGSPAIKEVVDDFIDNMKDKRRMAITQLTKGKLKIAPAREVAYVVDLLTKNIQLLSGKPTDNIKGLFSDEQSEAIARRILAGGTKS
jgi:hypothetical protein